jgi:hypothetical protein
MSSLLLKKNSANTSFSPCLLLCIILTNFACPDCSCEVFIQGMQNWLELCTKVSMVKRKYWLSSFSITDLTWNWQNLGIIIYITISLSISVLVFGGSETNFVQSKNVTNKSCHICFGDKEKSEKSRKMRKKLEKIR